MNASYSCSLNSSAYGSYSYNACQKFYQKSYVESCGISRRDPRAQVLGSVWLTREVPFIACGTEISKHCGSFL